MDFVLGKFYKFDILLGCFSFKVQFCGVSPSLEVPVIA